MSDNITNILGMKFPAYVSMVEVRIGLGKVGILMRGMKQMLVTPIT